MDEFLYLTTKGRETGEPRQIEIWFVERERCFYIVSEGRDASHWVKNILHDPAVSFSVGTRGDPGSRVPVRRTTARIVREADEPELVRAVAELMNGKYGWSDGLVVEIAGG